MNHEKLIVELIKLLNEKIAESLEISTSTFYGETQNLYHAAKANAYQDVISYIEIIRNQLKAETGSTV